MSNDLMIEILKNVQTNVAALRDDMGDVKNRLATLERSVVGMRRDLADSASLPVENGIRIDKLADRVARVESRLNLID